MKRKTIIRLCVLALMIAVASISVYAAATVTKNQSVTNSNHGVKGVAELQIYTDSNAQYVGTTNVSLSSVATSSNPTYSKYSVIISLKKPYDGNTIESYTGTINIGEEYFAEDPQH